MPKTPNSHTTAHALHYRPAHALTRRMRERLPELALSAWAAFWAWFFVTDGVSDYLDEGRGSAVAVAMIALVTLGGLVGAAWLRPRLGSLLLVGFGIFALWFFQGAVAVLLLALPALVLGAIIQAGSRSAAPHLADADDGALD